MKLNFWQWIGVILILGVVVWIIVEKTKSKDGGALPSSKPAGQY